MAVLRRLSLTAGSTATSWTWCEGAVVRRRRRLSEDPCCCSPTVSSTPAAAVVSCTDVTIESSPCDALMFSILTTTFVVNRCTVLTTSTYTVSDSPESLFDQILRSLIFHHSVSAELQPLRISQQSSTTTKTRLASVYHMHVPGRTYRRSQSWNNQVRFIIHCVSKKYPRHFRL